MRMVWESSGVRFIREMVSVYFDRRVSRSAAELAYFLVLSFFPVLICVNAFVGLLRLDVNLVLEAAEGILPQEVLPILGEYLGYITINQSNTLLFAGLTMVLFSASAAFRALMNIMADIYERPTYQGVGQVVASVLFSVLFLVTIYLSIAVLLTGSWFLHLVEGRFAWIAQVVDSWQSLRFLLATVALVAASMLFSWFIGLSSRYSLVYGSLASVIILLVWLYLCGNILILGNVFNYVWYKRKKR